MSRLCVRLCLQRCRKVSSQKNSTCDTGVVHFYSCISPPSCFFLQTHTIKHTEFYPPQRFLRLSVSGTWSCLLPRPRWQLLLLSLLLFVTLLLLSSQTDVTDFSSFLRCSPFPQVSADGGFIWKCPGSRPAVHLAYFNQYLNDFGLMNWTCWNGRRQKQGSERGMWEGDRIPKHYQDRRQNRQQLDQKGRWDAVRAQQGELATKAT